MSMFNRSSLREVFDKIEAANPEIAETEKRLGSRAVVADNVMRLRLQRGWTQGRLAEELGVRQPRIAQIEGASANLRLDTLDAIAMVFGVPVSSLLEKTEPRERRIVRPAKKQPATAA